MQIQVDSAQGKVPVTIVRVYDDIDALSFQEIIETVAAKYKEGTRNVLLDLRGVGFMSSAGLVAIQSIIMILNLYL
jgi:anti-anti-sigma factor